MLSFLLKGKGHLLLTKSFIFSPVFTDGKGQWKTTAVSHQSYIYCCVYFLKGGCQLYSTQCNVRPLWCGRSRAARQSSQFISPSSSNPYVCSYALGSEQNDKAVDTSGPNEVSAEGGWAKPLRLGEELRHPGGPRRRAVNAWCRKHPIERVWASDQEASSRPSLGNVLGPGIDPRFAG